VYVPEATKGSADGTTTTFEGADSVPESTDVTYIVLPHANKLYKVYEWIGYGTVVYNVSFK
jgi:hypothetical protein